jgi:hypothetical protein
MEWHVGYRDRLRDTWREVEAFFDGLTPGLHEQGRLLRVDLGLAWSATGRMEDLLHGPGDAPVLHEHLWILDDLGVNDDALKHRISRSVLLTLALVHLHEGIRGPGSPFDRTSVPLAEELARGASIELQAVIQDHQGLADLHTDGWRRFHGGMLDDPVIPRSPDEVLKASAARLAPFLVGPASVALAAGRESLLTGLIALLDDLHGLLVVRRDLLRSRSDLFLGRVRPALGWAAWRFGVDLPARPEEVMGAMIVSDSVDRLAEAWTAWLERCRSAGSRLGLERLARYAEDLRPLMDELHDLFDVRQPGGWAPPTSEVAAASTGTTSDLLTTGIDTAARYLLSDPSFRQSWEVHRWGLGGAEEVTATFPAGLVLEILGRQDHSVGPLVDEFSEAVRKRGFAYYDHPGLPQVDSDTLGVLLRLHRFSGDREAHGRIVEEHLAVLLERLGPDGRIPVWLSTGGKALVLGEGCGVIAAGVVSGLIDYDGARRAEVVALTARHVIESFVERGAGISVNYPAAYALVVVADLLDRLREMEELAELAERAWPVLLEEIGRWRIGPLTPQRAGLLARACLRERGRHLFDPEWIDVLLEQQRSDGRWQGEPFFFVPNRGRSVTWYATDLMTSALCYDALATYAAMTP